MSPRRSQQPPSTSPEVPPAPRRLALVPPENPPPATAAAGMPSLSAEEDMYARAALACYAKALTTDDPDLVTNLLEAGAWFARLGNNGNN